MKKAFTIIIHTENTIGLLVRLTSIFSRRRIPITSLNVVAEAENMYRFAIVIEETEEVTIKLVQQIDKQVEVFESFFQINEEVSQQPYPLFKTSNTDKEKQRV